MRKLILGKFINLENSFLYFKNGFTVNRVLSPELDQTKPNANNNDGF